MSRRRTSGRPERDPAPGAAKSALRGHWLRLRPVLVAAALAPMLAPVVAALTARADDDAAPGGPPALVAEQVSTARDIVPFGLGAGPDRGAATVWAFGRAGGPAPTGGGAANAGSATLLTGTIADASTPSAWSRAGQPVDRDGQPLAPGSWAPAGDPTDPSVAPATGATPSLHAGGGTPEGAAALLVRITPAGGGAARTAVLARASDGRFHELPAPPAALAAPASDPFDGAGDALVPVAVIDVPIRSADGDRGRTGVLLAPAGADGVLRWNGSSWSKQPWLEPDGTQAGARTALALEATPAGDAVALFAGDPSGGSAARVQLARSTTDATAFRSVPVTGSRLLAGALPAGIAAIRPVPSPGQPLTVAPSHWWIDLQLTTSAGTSVSATVHLRPPADRPAPGPAVAGAVAAPATSPTTPPATTPDTTTTAPTTPTTTPSTTPTPGTTPAEADASWCSADGVCDRSLPFGWATQRGYVSAAFDDASSAKFGARSFSSPVLDGASGSGAAREASASGGFAVLARDGAFALRSGVGDDGTGGTQAAAFGSGGQAIVGGSFGVGRSMPASARRTGAVSSYDAGALDQLVDVALSPPGTPAPQAGAIEMTALMQFRRQAGTALWQYAFAPTPAAPSDAPQLARAIAWPAPNRMIVAGTNGLLFETAPPTAITSSAAGGDIAASTAPAPVSIPAAAGLDLRDVAAQGDDAWAVGDAGALLRRTATGWSRVALPTALATANLRSVAFAGADVWIASDRGLITIPAGSAPRLEPSVAALLRADGQTDGVRSVAGLADGTVVVDGRYVRLGAGAPWQRLQSPADGNVFALDIWREGAGGSSQPGTADTPIGGDALGSLRIAAAIAPARTSAGTQAGEEGDVPGGRLAELTPSGWVDRIRTPLARSLGRDLAVWSPPITAIVTDASGDGWAVGGAGSSTNSTGEVPAQSPTSFDAPIGDPPFDAAPPDRATAGAPPSPPAAGPAPAARLLIGGHPACLDECAGRGDQGLAPDELLSDAAATAAGIAGQTPAPTVLILGGGRASTGGDPLSEAGAARYLELLQRSSTPVIVGIGSGDAATDASRAAFARTIGAWASSDRGAPLTPVRAPALPASFAASGTVAYAMDLQPAGGAAVARVVVIDNAGGALRGGPQGDQASWLREVLQSELPTVVVGAADLSPSGSATDRDAELAALAPAEAYVSTDAPGSPTDPGFGGGIASLGTDTTNGGRLALFRSSALSPAAPPQAAGQAEDAGALVAGPGLLQLDLSAGARPDPSIVPVVGRFIPQPPLSQTRGVADIVAPLAQNSGAAGYSAPASLLAGPGAPETSGESVDVRGPLLRFLAAVPCRAFATSAACAGQLPIDATFTVDDPSIATFVRAAPGRRNQPPSIVVDGSGNPITDSSSGVLCPRRAGATTVRVVISGRTLAYPLQVSESRGAAAASPGRTACSFLASSPSPPPAGPAAAPPPPAVVSPTTPAAATRDRPRRPASKRRQRRQPAAPTAAAKSPNLPPQDAGSAAAPPSANPKPAAPPAQPPPTGGTAGQPSQVFQSSTQGQTASSVVLQREEEREVAQASSELHASRVMWAPAVVGGVGLLSLTIVAGAAGGRRRRQAVRRYAWLR